MVPAVNFRQVSVNLTMCVPCDDLNEAQKTDAPSILSYLFFFSFFLFFIRSFRSLYPLFLTLFISLSLSQLHATPAHIVLPSPSPIEAPYVSHPYIPSRPSSAHRWERLNGYKITLLSLGFLQIGFFQIEVQIHHQYSSESSLSWVSFNWITSNDVAPTLNGVIADLLIKSNYFCCLSF